jgi:hypothetical protein
MRAIARDNIQGSTRSNCEANNHKSDDVLRQKCGISVRGLDVDGDRILLSESPFSYATARKPSGCTFYAGFTELDMIRQEQIKRGEGELKRV